MKKAMKQLLDALDKIYETDGEVNETSVREAMHEAIHRSFIEPEPEYALPDEFGMFTPAGDRKVKAALARFIAHSEVAEAAETFKTPLERLEAFQDMEAESSHGNTYDVYFGHAEVP